MFQDSRCLTETPRFLDEIPRFPIDRNSKISEIPKPKVESESDPIFPLLEHSAGSLGLSVLSGLSQADRKQPKWWKAKTERWTGGRTGRRRRSLPWRKHSAPMAGRRHRSRRPERRSWCIQKTAKIPNTSTKNGLYFCHMSSARSTSDGRGPVTRKGSG